MTKRGRHTDDAGDAGYPGGTGADASFWTGQPDHPQGYQATAGDPASGPADEATHEAATRQAVGDAATQQIELPPGGLDDDLEQQLAELAPQRVLSRTTLALAAVVLVVAGFLGGLYVQRNYGSEPAASAGADNRGAGFAGGNGYPGGAMPSGFANRQGRNGAPGGTGDTGAGGQSSTTTGKVKLVDGTTVYIETSDGQTVIVKTDGSTKVQTSQPSTLKDLTAGAQVTVEGTGSGGNITATKITKGS